MCVTFAGPMAKNVQPRIMRSGRVYKAEFVGHVVGGYQVELAYGGMHVPGSPFTCNLYDLSRVKITESAASASVGQPVAFAGEFWLHLVNNLPFVAPGLDSEPVKRPKWTALKPRMHCQL